jgi:ATP-dependent DNA helicase RecQ
MYPGTAIVISPLIALMKNQVDAMRGFSTEDGIAHFLNSSLNKNQILTVKSDILSGKTKLLYVAPESLTKQENVDFLRQIPISFYAIDEAHCISEWGHDFRPEYRRIRPIIEEISRAPIIALTATATPKVQHDIMKNLGMLGAEVYKDSFFRHNLYYEVRPKSNITKQIIRIIKDNPNKSGIIYCLSRKKVEELTESLVVNGIHALAYHAGMDSATRAGNQDKFLMEEVEVIVATIAFGMGIDKPDVRFVIHYDMPKSLEGYYQETGRAGRDGGEGRCIAFYSYKDIQKLEKFMQGKPVAEQEIGKQLLLETVAYAESALCRPKMLLNYFGEELHEPCENCDNCLNPKERFEGQEFILLALKCIVEVKEKFKAEHITKILSGKSDSVIKSYGHDELESYGAGDEHDEKLWLAVLRQALVEKLIAKEIENYGVVKLTPKGRDYLLDPYPLQLVKNHIYEDEDDEGASQQGGSSSADPVLFGLLKDLRKKTAKKKSIPPFVIFQDPSLEDMSIQYPITMDELTNIIGVGTGKAKKYGADFIKLIADYVTENNIDRPQDMIVKSVVNKSTNKVYFIQSIDRKLMLDDIASAKDMSMSELLTEIEAIVNSGTRINIDYYIQETIDEEHQDALFDYFHEAESESVELALTEFANEDITEDEIRLMRIKFLSELGN